MERRVRGKGGLREMPGSGKGGAREGQGRGNGGASDESEREE